MSCCSSLAKKHHVAIAAQHDGLSVAEDLGESRMVSHTQTHTVALQFCGSPAAERQ